MAQDAAVSVLVGILISNIEEWVTKEISLIKSVNPKLLKRVSLKLGNIQTVLQDAEKRSLQDDNVKRWLDDLKDISYEMEDVIDEWNTSISKLKLKDQPSYYNPKISYASMFTSCVSPLKNIGFRHDLGSKIEDIDERLDFVSNNMNTFKFDVHVVDSVIVDRVTTSIINISETYGRYFDEKTILNKLLSEDTSSEVYRKIPTISIVGVGGLGKTTLAKLVYNNDDVVKSFSKRIWVCVSDPFDMDKVAKDILQAIRGSPLNECSRNLLLQYLRESISDVKFLLILDDVWDEEGSKWIDLRNCLEGGMSGSRILVTTRKENVAKAMDTGISNLYHLGKLSDQACLDIFCQIAFYDIQEKRVNESLKRIGLEIVKKCKGLPLAVRTLGNILRLKGTDEEEWQRVLDSEIWKIEKVGVELFPHLYLSYNELTPPIKRCFSYCSIFPKDTEIKVDELIRLWMAQGYVILTNGEDNMEPKGREYFDKLAASCFFQEFAEDKNGKIFKCKMHDIVHDFAQYLASNEIAIIFNEIQNSVSQKARRHVNWAFEKRLPLSTHDDVGNLRSLFMNEYSVQHLGVLINHLKCVRSLVLKSCNLKKLPKEIGDLVHLRLLDLSWNDDLVDLPDSLCELYNLQILDINMCQKIKRLPKAIGKLINLRHLIIHWSQGLEGLNEYPKSFERLTSLRTLTQFKVGRKYGKLEYLKDLNHLSGIQRILICCSGMKVTEMVSDAIESQLKNKKHIQELSLRFEENEEDGVDVAELHEAVLEALLPPCNVTRLNLERFNGAQYPRWLTNDSHFNNLRWLRILQSVSLTFPPLGKLPCLESLVIGMNRNIKHIGKEFLGIEESAVVAFPKLVELTFYKLNEWEEWEDLNEEYDNKPSIQIMPCLRSLVIDTCKKLEQLPHRLLHKASSLDYLEIKYFLNSVPVLSLRNCQQQVEQLLSHIPKIRVNDTIYTSDNPTGTI